MRRRRAGIAALAATCALAVIGSACTQRQAIRALQATSCSDGRNPLCTPPPRDAIEASSAAVGQILAGARTRAELTAALGRRERLCVASSPSLLVCEWRIEFEAPRWSELAAMLPTEDPLNLLCELPADGAERAPDSCIVFPRRSNRFLYLLPYSRTPSRTAKPPADRAEVRARYQREASAEIAWARTVAELSYLVGAAPNACEDLQDATQGCVWGAANATYGHGTLAFSVSASSSEKVRMRCILPTDGSPRASGSCELEVPGRVDHHGAR